MFLRFEERSSSRTQKFATIASEPERSAKGGNGIKSEGFGERLYAGFRPCASEGGGNRCSPTPPCVRSAGRFDVPRPTADSGGGTPDPRTLDSPHWRNFFQSDSAAKWPRALTWFY